MFSIFTKAYKEGLKIGMSKNDLKKVWFSDKKSVLVASGASVSKKNVEEIVEELKKYKNI